MKLSVAAVCTVVVTLIAATTMVDAKPALVRRGLVDWACKNACKEICLNKKCGSKSDTLCRKGMGLVCKGYCDHYKCK
ncbi:hypothetical protein BDF19DRAFT_449406 [Syncephalis fuscata]|nr:hypothetical protein BDF19DRAFT_449406 [Syncephalis fuscata]